MPSLPESIYTDADRVIQIFQNVMTQAISLSNFGGLIDVKCSTNHLESQLSLVKSTPALNRKLNIELRVTCNYQYTQEQLQTFFDIKGDKVDVNHIGMHVAKLLSKELEGSLSLKQNEKKFLVFSI